MKIKVKLNKYAKRNTAVAPNKFNLAQIEFLGLRYENLVKLNKYAKQDTALVSYDNK